MIHLKILESTYDSMRRDLNKQHPFAYERVGFMFARKDIREDAILLLATDYFSIPDNQYINDLNVGAKINSAALRSVMERAYSSKECILHVHLHDHFGPPGLSRVDRIGYSHMIPSFHNIGGGAIHGAVIFSLNNATGLIWTSKTGLPVPVNKLTIVGSPLEIQKIGVEFHV
jgi:hypothetical protein